MAIFNQSDKFIMYICVIAGTIALLLGLIGIVIPLLPTTPFLLLAAICYFRGSKRMYNALLRNRVFGSYIVNYLEGRGMPLRIKIVTLLLLWLAIIIAALISDSILVRIFLFLILIGVTVHILLLKTINKRAS